MTSVTFPDSLTTIGNNSFQGCSSLTSIIIPDGVTSIGVFAFGYCSSLTITIPSSVTLIYFGAFTDVKQVNVPNSTIQNLVQKSGYTGTINVVN